jgi:hypothetical protein
VDRYRPQARDTNAAVDRLVFDGFRRMTPAQRLELAAAAFRSVEQLSIAGLRLRHPDLDDEQLRRRAGARRLGRELTLRAFGQEAEAWLD